MSLYLKTLIYLKLSPTFSYTVIDANATFITDKDHNHISKGNINMSWFGYVFPYYNSTFVNEKKK